MCWKWLAEEIIAELRRPRAAMRSPIPIEDRTHAFIFSWSSWPAVWRADASVRATKSRNMAPVKIELIMRPHLGNLNFILEIHIMANMTAIKTRYPLTSLTWPYLWLKCGTHQSYLYFEVNRWPGYGFLLDCGLKYWKHKKGATLLGLTKSIYYLYLLHWRNLIANNLINVQKL